MRNLLGMILSLLLFCAIAFLVGALYATYVQEHLSRVQPGDLEKDYLLLVKNVLPALIGFLGSLLMAFLLDLIFGPPPVHPVTWIRAFTTYLDTHLGRWMGCNRWTGLLLLFLVLGGTFLTVWTLVYLAYQVRIGSVNLSIILETVLLYLAIGPRSLAEQAMRVYTALTDHDLYQAQRGLSSMVGRDTLNLDREATAAACIESVAEKTVESIISPLFYFFIGFLISPPLAAPFAFSFRALTTLKGMVGHFDARYREMGFFTAKLDEILNFIPSRLMYLLIPLANGFRNFFRIIRVMVRDGQKHASPNSGISEAGFAGAIGILLGGPASYDGVLEEKPYLGERVQEIRPAQILSAVALMYRVTISFITVLVILALLALGMKLSPPKPPQFLPKAIQDLPQTIQDLPRTLQTLPGKLQEH